MQILPNHPDTSAFEPVESENWSRWPAVSALPNRLQIDMETLIGREKNQRALDGTVVILDPGHGGKIQAQLSLPKTVLRFLKRP